MANFKVFLTKSPEAAKAIARGFTADWDNNEICIEQDIIKICSVSHGDTIEQDIIPVMYQGKEYFYCAMEYIGESQMQKYELIIC